MDDELLAKGDGASTRDTPLPPVTAQSRSTLVLFFVDLAARYSMAGTISGA